MRRALALTICLATPWGVSAQESGPLYDPDAAVAPIYDPAPAPLIEVGDPLSVTLDAAPAEALIISPAPLYDLQPAISEDAAALDQAAPVATGLVHDPEPVMGSTEPMAITLDAAPQEIAADPATLYNAQSAIAPLALDAVAPLAPNVTRMTVGGGSVLFRADDAPASPAPQSAGGAALSPVPLAPGESILTTIPVGRTIVRAPIPAAPRPAAPLPRPSSVETLDFGAGGSVSRSVSGRSIGPLPAPRKLAPPASRQRDQAGWTGNRGRPISIGCFPAGSCAALNVR